MARPAEQDDFEKSSLFRGLTLLEQFESPGQVVSISQLARQSGVPKSTAHRLVQNLVGWGALERCPTGVRLGARLFELGTLVAASTSLRDLAIPYAHALHEVTKLTCNLAVREGDEILYIEKISTRAMTVPHSRLGGRARMHATALGKAILAFSEPAFVDDVLSKTLAAQTPKTVVDPDRLRKQLAEVRKARVAYDVEESRLGLFCVAAPIFSGTNGPVIGAISVTGASQLATAQKYAPTVTATAIGLSASLQPRRSRGHVGS